jgi:hypothetical protein
MGIFPEKNWQGAQAAQASEMMEDGALCHGNGGGRGNGNGNGSDTTVRILGDRAGGVERGEIGDVDLDTVKPNVNLGEFR